MSDIRNRSFLIRLAFDPILKPRLCGVQNDLACGNCNQWYQSKIYFLVPDYVSVVEDLVKLIRVEHGILSGIGFNAAGFSVPLRLPVESLKEIKEPIEVIPVGPEVPKVNFPRCKCAAAAVSDQVNEMILKLNGAKIGESAETTVAGTCHKSGKDETYVIPCCQNPPSLNGETENDDRHQSSNALSEPTHVTTSEEMIGPSGSQDGMLDQCEEPNGDSVASGPTTHVSNSPAQESLSTQRTYGTEEPGVSTGSEEMGSVVAIFSKEKQDQNEHGSVVSGSENTTASSLEQSEADGQSNNSSAEWITLSSNAEETIESGENVDEKEVRERDAHVEEDSSSKMVVEASYSKANILEENLLEEKNKRSGTDLTSEEMGIPEKKARTDSMIVGGGTPNESLRIRELLTGETVLSDDAENLCEASAVMSSTPKPSKDITNGTSSSNHTPKILDSTTASKDDSNETILSQDDFDDQDQEPTEPFAKSIFV